MSWPRAMRGTDVINALGYDPDQRFAKPGDIVGGPGGVSSDALAAGLAAKADIAAVADLATVVASKADTSSVQTLADAVGSKASTAALGALATAVADKASLAALQAQDVRQGVPSAKIGAQGWLEALIGNTERVGATVSIHPQGGAGIVGASRTSDSQNTGGMSTWGGGFFVSNDNTTQRQTGYGLYVEPRRAPGAGNTHGIEIGMVNRGSVVSHTPYTMIPDGLTPALWLSAGRGDVPDQTNPSLAMGVIGGPGNCKWQSGIVFDKSSLAGGVNGFAPPVALGLPQGYAVAWYSPVNAGVVGSIRSDVTAAAGNSGGSIIFTDTGMVIQAPNASQQFTLTNTGVTLGTLRVNGGTTLAGQADIAGAVFFLTLPQQVDNAAAIAAGLAVNRLYRTADGTLKVRV